MKPTFSAKVPELSISLVRPEKKKLLLAQTAVFVMLSASKF
jgi:hypothetical protein